jgi:ribosomal 50S subunit-associated protein YjgA (DUF615 family)
MMSNYLQSVLIQFKYYKDLGDRTIDQLNFEELQKELIEDSNSISVITKHLAGNMLSRWTNFLTEDGEKQWRQRDDEFIDSIKSKEELKATWEKGWNCLFNAIEPLKESDLQKIVYIRNQGHTISEAINRQMMHYAYHIGQIVYIGKLLKAKDWQTLSIAKGKSMDYNKEKFQKDKGRRHFTEDL